MLLLKINHPTLLALGFERTLELSCAFKNTGIQLKTVLMCFLCQNSVHRDREESRAGGGGTRLFLHYFLEISLDTEMSHFSFLHQDLDSKTSCSLAATLFLSNRRQR